MNENNKVMARRFFTAFIKWHGAFLVELASRYVEYGRFPFIPVRELAKCYDDEKDISIAALAGIVINDNKHKEEYVRDFRILLGDNPYRWFENRSFSVLSTGANQGRMFCGYESWKVARYFDGIQSAYNGSFKNLPTDPLMELVGNKTLIYRLDLLRLVLGTSDGIGLGVWDIDDHALRCPGSRDVRAFMKMWFPEFILQGDKGSPYSLREAIALLGFKRDVDFFYSYLGWQELCRRNPKGCGRYVTLYQKRYRERNLLEKKYWTGERHGIIPEIDFSV